MTWTADVTFVHGLDFFSAVVDQVPNDGWERPSPCAGWSALDVLGHVGFATEFGTKLLRSETPDFSGFPDPPRSAVTGDPQQWWQGMVAPAKEAVRGVDLTRVVDSPIGKRSIGDGLSFPGVDLFIHGWDLAHSVGSDVVIPADAMDFAHQVLDPIPDQQKRSPRVFGPEKNVPTDASPQVRFLAWAGRDAT
jgi:uncharacterized protein (TIGR03086 family)